jgi:DNA-binding transcriptional ArsR family regulator
VDVFGVLADPVRRALLEELATGPTRVVDLAARHPISRPAVSKHLRLLSEAGLVTVADVGRERHYALAPAALRPVADLLARLAAPAGHRPTGPVTDRALDALETEVRRTVRDRRARRAGAGGPREETA